ncbi:hypothetical protein [Phormidium nigroviride]
MWYCPCDRPSLGGNDVGTLLLQYLALIGYSEFIWLFNRQRGVKVDSLLKGETGRLQAIVRGVFWGDRLSGRVRSH